MSAARLRAGGTRRRAPPRRQSVAAFLTRCEVRPAVTRYGCLCRARELVRSARSCGRGRLRPPARRSLTAQAVTPLAERPRGAPATPPPPVLGADGAARAASRAARDVGRSATPRQPLQCHMRGCCQRRRGACRPAERAARTQPRTPRRACFPAQSLRLTRSRKQRFLPFCALIRVSSQTPLLRRMTPRTCNTTAAACMLTAWPSSLALCGVSWWQLGLLDGSSAALRVAMRSYPRRFRRNAQRCVTLLRLCRAARRTNLRQRRRTTRLQAL